MSIKNLLRKAAQLVVELPPEPEPVATLEPIFPAEVAPPVPVVTKSVEQIVREAPGPNLDQIVVPPIPVTAPSAPAGHVDFLAVYQSAGLAPAAFSAEQAFDVIESLPKELPLEARRAAVHATISAMGRAMGVNTQGVIADAGRKVAALSAYEDMLTHQTESYVATIQAKIADLEAQIALHREDIETTRNMLVSAVQACDTESARLDDVLEFFTLDSQPSRNA